MAPTSRSPPWPAARRIGGPVGSGKTALMEQLCKRFKGRYDPLRDHERHLHQGGRAPPHGRGCAPRGADHGRRDRRLPRTRRSREDCSIKPRGHRHDDAPLPRSRPDPARNPAATISPPRSRPSSRNLTNLRHRRLRRREDPAQGRGRASPPLGPAGHQQDRPRALRRRRPRRDGGWTRRACAAKPGPFVFANTRGGEGVDAGVGRGFLEEAGGPLPPRRREGRARARILLRPAGKDEGEGAMTERFWTYPVAGTALAMASLATPALAHVGHQSDRRTSSPASRIRRWGSITCWRWSRAASGPASSAGGRLLAWPAAFLAAMIAAAAWGHGRAVAALDRARHRRLRRRARPRGGPAPLRAPPRPRRCGLAAPSPPLTATPTARSCRSARARLPMWQASRSRRRRCWRWAWAFGRWLARVDVRWWRRGSPEGLWWWWGWG